MNGFAPMMIFFEWVCSDDDFFLMGLNGLAPMMIFLIGGLGFKSAAWVSDHLGVVWLIRSIFHHLTLQNSIKIFSKMHIIHTFIVKSWECEPLVRSLVPFVVLANFYTS